jgi:uncharacterized membrane-anchored protein YjiN (DUF445 family)
MELRGTRPRELPPPESPGEDPMQGVRRMRRLATGLLCLVAALFLLTAMGEERWPWLGFFRAFCEAAMVGAIADWFAVVALFRHPLGIPIPHTAVVPQNHKRIADAIGRFVSTNFFASQAVARRLEELDVVGRLGRWLSSPEHASQISDRLMVLLPPIMEAIQREQLRKTVNSMFRRGLGMAITAPLLSSILSAAVAQRYHQSLLDEALKALSELLHAKRGFIRKKVAARSGWLPLWVEESLSEQIASGLNEALVELRSPSHPWRTEFENATREFIVRLESTPEFEERIEAIKTQILGDPAIEKYLDELWDELHDHLTPSAQTDGKGFRGVIEDTVRAVGDRIAGDLEFREMVGHWVRRGIEQFMMPRRELISSFIAGMVLRWPTDTLVNRLEAHVGRDLQYIRINGTIVGGCVGLGIYLAGMVAKPW